MKMRRTKDEEEQEEGGLGKQVDVGEYSTPWASAMAAHGPTDCELEILIGILCQWTMPTRPPNQAAQPPPPARPSAAAAAADEQV